MKTEQELIDQLKEAEMDLESARLEVSICKKRLTEAETVLVGAKINLERLAEELRVYRNKYVNDE